MPEIVEENTASNDVEIHPVSSSGNAQTQGNNIHPLSSSGYAKTHGNIHPELSSSGYAQTQDSSSHENLTITEVDLPSSPDEQQEHGSVSDYTAALKYCMLPLFSLVLVMKYQLKLREVSDKQWWIFFPAILVYCCVHMVERRGKNFYNKYYEKLDLVAFSSVILSLASLVSILIPKRFLYTPYIIWVLLALGKTYPWLCADCIWVCARTVSGVRFVLASMGWIEGIEISETLPVCNGTTIE